MPVIGCPNCSTKLKISETNNSKAVRCPKCVRTFKVADQGQAAITSVPPVKSATTAFQGPAREALLARSKGRVLGMRPWAWPVAGLLLVVLVGLGWLLAWPGDQNGEAIVAAPSSDGSAKKELLPGSSPPDQPAKRPVAKQEKALLGSGGSMNLGGAQVPEAGH
jgi:predicted Zn finger-like uncharacterized protein